MSWSLIFACATGRPASRSPTGSGGISPGRACFPLRSSRANWCLPAHFAISPNRSCCCGNLPRQKVPSLELVGSLRARTHHVADTFVANGRNGDLLLCFYRTAATHECVVQPGPPAPLSLEFCRVPPLVMSGGNLSNP